MSSNPKAENAIFIDDTLRLIREDYLYIMTDTRPVNAPVTFKKSDARHEIEWAYNLIKHRLDDMALYII